MKNKKSNKTILTGLEYLDDDIVSDVLKKLDSDRKTVSRRIARRRFSALAYVALVASLALILLAIPRTKTIISESVGSIVFSPADSGAFTKIEKNGSSGLLYEVNKDGKSASFIGFGACTEETVYIASTYEGLPVTEMRNDAYENVVPALEDQRDLRFIKHIVIPDSVVTVDPDCIRWCLNIESVYFGASVENIQSFSFPTGGLRFSRVEVSPDNPYYSDEGNCIVDLRTKALVLGNCKTVIPDNGQVEIIGMNAFLPAKRLTSVTIPKGVKIIDAGAFEGCSNLESVSLPDSLEVIENSAFAGCSKLKKIELGTNLISIDKTTFSKDAIPEVYYKGTVAEWEAVIKVNTKKYRAFIGRRGDTISTSYSYDPAKTKVFTVNCTDGVSDSNAGTNGNYDWRLLPEYKDYSGVNAKHGFIYYVVCPSGDVIVILPQTEE